MTSASQPAEATLLPPSYAPPHQTHPQTHSITDLRNQIVANAMLLYTRRGLYTYEEATPLLAVAKTAAPAPKQQDLEKRGLAGQGSSFAAEGPPSEKYYAVVAHGTPASNSVHVLLCGERRNTVLEALEDVLEQTARMVHEKVAKHV